MRAIDGASTPTPNGMSYRGRRTGDANTQQSLTLAGLIRAFEVLGAFLVPILILRSGMYQVHPRVGWVDPGLYIYNFFSLPENMARSTSTPVGSAYHFSRLPFVLPGYAIYRVLEPVRAQAALITAFYVLGLAGLFAVSRTLVSSVAGRLALVWVVALNPLWIAAFVEGYVDGPAMAFVLFSFAALASRKPRLFGVPRSFWAGVSVALALSTQPFAGGVAGLVVLIFSILAPATWRETILFLAWAAVGGICAIAGLGALGTRFGVPFLYLLSSMDWIRRVSNGALYEFVSPRHWLSAATRVALWPIAFALLARVALRRSSARGPGPAALLVAISVWTVLFMVGDIATANFFTQFRYYASYLFLSLVPALAVLIEDVSDDRTAGAVAALTPAAALSLGIALPLGVRWGFLGGGTSTSVGVRTWVAIAALGVAGCSADWIRKRKLGFIGIASSLALAGAANLDTAAIFATRTNPDHRATSAAVAEVHKAIAKTGFSNGRILSWFNRDAFTRATATGPVYEMDFAGQTYRYNLLDTIAASFGWSQTTFGFDMPEADTTWHDRFSTLDATPTAVLALCAHTNDCRIGEQTFAARGMLVNERVIRRVESPRVPAFSFIVFDVRLDPYPCALDRALLGANFDRLPELAGDVGLATALRTAMAQPGSLPSCRTQLRDMATRWPALTLASRAAAEQTCSAGLEFLTGLEGLSDATTDEYLEIERRRASAAADDSDWFSCVKAAFQGRRMYWQRPPGP